MKIQTFIMMLVISIVVSCFNNLSKGHTTEDHKVVNKMPIVYKYCNEIKDNALFCRHVWELWGKCKSKKDSLLCRERTKLADMHYWEKYNCNSSVINLKSIDTLPLCGFYDSLSVNELLHLTKKFNENGYYDTIMQTIYEMHHDSSCDDPHDLYLEMTKKFSNDDAVLYLKKNCFEKYFKYSTSVIDTVVVNQLKNDSSLMTKKAMRTVLFLTGLLDTQTFYQHIKNDTLKFFEQNKILKSKDSSLIFHLLNNQICANKYLGEKENDIMKTRTLSYIISRLNDSEKNYFNDAREMRLLMNASQCSEKLYRENKYFPIDLCSCMFGG